MNNVKTFVLMAGLLGLFLLAGQLIGGSSGLLAALDFSEGTFTRSIGIIHRKGKVFSAAAREFVRMLTAVR